MNLQSVVQKIGFFGTFGLSVLAGSLSANVGDNAQSLEDLKIYTDSMDEFAGAYLVDQHALKFDSYIDEEGDVTFNFSIDGKQRELHFQFDETELSLTTGEPEVTDQERVLMYDASKTLVDYLQKQEKQDLQDHLVVLVGALGSWNQLDLH